MKRLFDYLIFCFLLACIAAGPARAADYPTLGFDLPLNAPRFTALSATLPTTQGEVAVALQLSYGGGARLACAAGSTVDGSPADCRGTQNGGAYTLAITAGATRIALKGQVAANVATATYKGPMGKLIGRKAEVVPQFVAAPVVSRVILSPRADGKGKLSGAGHIESGYGGVLADVPVKGSIKKSAVKWALKYPSDKLSFTGKEQGGNWSGKLTGNVGPAKVSARITIPLQPYNPVTPGGEARFHGTVSTSDGSAGAVPAPGVIVAIRSDFNNNGAVDAGESVTAQTDGNGNFDRTFPVAEGRPVTVDFDRDGYSKTPKVFASVAPGADIPVNTTLRKLDDLAVSGGAAKSPDGKLQLENLPASVESLQGRVFNPVNESAQFPGEFADDSGNMLISSVFSAVEAKDARGNPVTELAAGTKIRMQVPRETWGTLRDLKPGTGRIDVPLYYFDEATGEWKRSTSDGWLEDEAEASLPESALASLKDGSRSGNVYAAGTITHLSYWNIDWPIDTHGCVAGRIVDGSGNPVAGAVVTAKGATYTGASAPLTTGESGRFCIDVMRSEGAGDDLDGDGVTGEQNRITLSVYANGKYYDLGTHAVPPNPATCAGGGCVDLGDLVLEPGREVAASVCTITGKVVYSGTATGGDPGLAQDAPIAGASVFAFDSDAEDLLIECILNASCTLSSTTDAGGSFSLTVPILLGAEVVAYQFGTDPANPYAFRFFSGNGTTNGCPTAPFTIRADYFSYTPTGGLIP